MALIPGKRFTLADGKPYILPPLTMRQMRLLDEEGVLSALSDVTKPREVAAAGFRIIHASLSKNYPSTALEEVEGLVDVGLVEAIIVATMGKSRPEDRVSDPDPKA
jgi:hypothetical protein